MSDKRIVPQTGGTPTPDQVVGRDELIASMLQKFRDGTSFIISDPRRMGKTSLLIRLCANPGPDVHAVHVDLEGSTSVAEVTRRLFDAVAKHRTFSGKARKALGGLIDGAKVDVGPLSLSATAETLPAEEVLTRGLESIEAHMANDDELLIIAVDEVTKALENLCRDGSAAADDLLQTLRRFRGRPNSRVRWILTGSVGFHHVIRKANSTEAMLDEAEIVDLGPLLPGPAGELAESLFRGIDRAADDDVVESLVARTSGIPFLLHQAIAPLRGSSGSVDVAAAQAAYGSFVNDRSRSAPATHLVTRLQPYYEDHELAGRVLDHFATAGEAVSFDDLCAQFDHIGRPAMLNLHNDLVDDHYLDPAGTQWRYDALLEIWKLRRRLG